MNPRRQSYQSDEPTHQPTLQTSFDYKDPAIGRYLSERGDILPRDVTRLTAKQQRKLTVAVKRARHLALLPFVTTL